MIRRLLHRLLMVLSAVLAGVFLLAGAPAGPATANTASPTLQVAILPTAEASPALQKVMDDVEAKFGIDCTYDEEQSDGVGTRTITCDDPASESGNECKTLVRSLSAKGLDIVICSNNPDVLAAHDAGTIAKAIQDTKLDMGCGFGDVICAASEDMGQWMSQTIIDGTEWALDQSSFTTTSSLWDVATNEAAFWFTVTVLVSGMVMVITIVLSLFQSRPGALIRALTLGAATFATTWFAVWATGYALNISDAMTEPLMERVTGEGGLSALLQKLMAFSGEGVNVASIVSPTQLVFFLLLYVIGVVVMIFVISFRNLALGVLIMIAPIAFVAMGAKIGRQWIVRWISAVLALLLTKPLMIGLLVMVLNGLGDVDGTGGLYSIQALPLWIGFLLTLFVPFAAFGLFSVVAGSALGAIDSVGQRSGQSLNMRMQQGMRSWSSRRPSAGGGRSGGTSAGSGSAGKAGAAGAAGAAASGAGKAIKGAHAAGTAPASQSGKSPDSNPGAGKSGGESGTQSPTTGRTAGPRPPGSGATPGGSGGSAAGAASAGAPPKQSPPATPPAGGPPSTPPAQPGRAAGREDRR